MAFIIKLESLADGRIHKTLTNKFLKSFDVDGNNGRGSFDGTSDPKEAIQFDSITDVFDFWSTQSKVLPFRPDGGPNCPLMSFNIEVVVS